MLKIVGKLRKLFSGLPILYMRKVFKENGSSKNNNNNKRNEGKFRKYCVGG